MHLLKQGAKPSKPRKERKKFAIPEFFEPQEEEEEKKEEEPEERPDGMDGVFYNDPEVQARQSKRNKGRAPPK